MASAKDELLGLDKEFYFADAAATKLEVSAFGVQTFVHLIGVDLSLDRVDVGDCREVEVATPDEGLQLGQERIAADDVAAADARLDHRRKLEFVALRGGAQRFAERGFDLVLAAAGRASGDCAFA